MIPPVDDERNLPSGPLAHDPHLWRDGNYGGPVKRIWPYLVPGILLSAVGLVWTLQGLNVLGGSAMSGSPLWATIGPIVLLLGVVLIGIAIVIARRRRQVK